jgi:hypothetical protein
MGRHCFDTSALDGGLSKTELMAEKLRGGNTIWQHCVRATVFGRVVFRVVKNVLFHNRSHYSKLQGAHIEERYKCL